jgi:hypothetical protein
MISLNEKKKFKGEKIFNLFSKSKISIIFLFKDLSVVEKLDIQSYFKKSYPSSLLRRVDSKYLKKVILKKTIIKKYDPIFFLMRGSFISVNMGGVDANNFMAEGLPLGDIKKKYNLFFIKVGNIYYFFDMFKKLDFNNHKSSFPLSSKIPFFMNTLCKI